MKKLLALAALLIATPAFANPPFKYKTPCFMEVGEDVVIEDVCTVVETRSPNGFLKSRNIYSNKWMLTIKVRWDEEKKKYVQWDSHNQFNYDWTLKTGNIPNSKDVYTYLMPGVLVESVSYN
jgi:hypothetical protein